MADSWEDQGEDVVLQPTRPRLRADAPAFTFNPGASSFQPPAYNAQPMQQTAFAAPQPPVDMEQAPDVPSFQQAAYAPGTEGPPPGFAAPPAAEQAAEAGKAERPPPPDDHPMEDVQSQLNGAGVQPESERDPPAMEQATAQMDRMAVDDEDDHDDGPAADDSRRPDGGDAGTGGGKAANGPSSSAQPPDRPPSAAPSASASAPASAPATPPGERADGAENGADSADEGAVKRVRAALAEMDQRDHLNVVFIGHVDAGKSTIGGQILYLTGGVDERSIQKYEREAKEKNRESWYMAYIMDTNDEERAKGKTVEVGRAHFETEAKRYTILDAPGHKNYVPNMIGGAAQADVGVLVIAARKGEFETGFERGGQTREHALLAKTLGVTKLIVAVNKMDEPSITGPGGVWSEERYNEIMSKLTQFLVKSCGYNPKKDIVFVPISGLFGTNIKDPVEPKVAPWYKGGTLFSVLDSTEPFQRDAMAPFRMPVIDKYKEMGTIVMGKSESGLVTVGDKLLVMPNKVPVTVATVYRDDLEVQAAKGGENLRLRLAGIDDDDIASGFVVCSRDAVVPAVTYFNAQLQILELLEHKAIFTAGYKCILHVHSVVEECECVKLIAVMDPKTKEKKKAKFVKSGAVAVVQLGVEKPICVELFSDVPQLGRFTLRDEGRTIAVGKIVKLPKAV